MFDLDQCNMDDLQAGVLFVACVGAYHSFVFNDNNDGQPLRPAHNLGFTRGAIFLTSRCNILLLSCLEGL